MNFNRMTIRNHGDKFQVFKMKRERVGGYATDMAGARFAYFVSRAAVAQFAGSYSECLEFITANGAEFMSEHGIGV